LLNLLDGTLEANGRILIITTNFPERIDRALIRPGRVDMIVNFKKCNRAVLREMVEAFYEQPAEIPDDESLDYKWSPAEVNQILFRNFGNPDQAIRELITLTRDDMYGFVENGNDVVEDMMNIQNVTNTD
jgi:chaperone BCS1